MRTALKLRVEYWRKYRGYTLAQLAKLSSVSKSTLSEIKNGTKTTLNSKQKENLAIALGVSVSELEEEEIEQEHLKIHLPKR